ncbi:hypothetical protein YC2023_079942 [Brassica napus]
MKIKVRGFARSDYESDFCKVSSQLTTEVLFEVQLVFQGGMMVIFDFVMTLLRLSRRGNDLI